MPEETKENRYTVAATIDIGAEREVQEDFIKFTELDENTLLVVIADGAGSRGSDMQPASIVVHCISDLIKDKFDEDSEYFFEKPEFHLRDAMKSANLVLEGFKLGNEERFGGYAASVTCLLCAYRTVIRKGKEEMRDRIYVAHAGNTRLYMLRGGVLTQFTEDHTVAAEYLRKGEIDIESYHIHPARLTMTSGVGMYRDMQIQSFGGNMQENDILIMTTDGVHYAVRAEHIARLVLEQATVDDAARALIEGAKSVGYTDNMTAAVIAVRK